MITSYQLLGADGSHYSKLPDSPYLVDKVDSLWPLLGVDFFNLHCLGKCVGELPNADEVLFEGRRIFCSWTEGRLHNTGNVLNATEVSTSKE